MHPVPTINHPCTLCCRPTSMWCSRCQSAWYCSPEHLHNVSNPSFSLHAFMPLTSYSQDWARHRRECIPAVNSSSQGYNMIATPPPAEPQFINVSAILFSPEEGKTPVSISYLLAICSFIEHVERPRIISISCRPSHKPSQGMCPIPLVQSYFPEGPPEGIVLTQGLNGEPLRFPLNLWYSPSALANSAPVNRAIYHITSGAAPKAWCGTVVVLKFNGSRRQGYSDAGSNDLPALSAYFLAFK